MLPVKFASPPYVAVMLWVPVANSLTDRVAAPLALREEFPRLVTPSLKVTVPVGVPLPDCGAWFFRPRAATH